MLQDRAGIQSIGRRLGPRPWAPDLRLTAIRSPGLPFNGRHPRNPCNYMNHYSFTDPGGMEGWVGLLYSLLSVSIAGCSFFVVRWWIFGIYGNLGLRDVIWNLPAWIEIWIHTCQGVIRS